MKVNCLTCGFGIELDPAYAKHYEGEVKCVVCGSRLGLSTDQGRIRSAYLVNGQFDGSGFQSAMTRSGRTVFRHSSLARADAWKRGLRHNQ
jgi:hypothetical protein